MSKSFDNVLIQIRSTLLEGDQDAVVLVTEETAYTRAQFRDLVAHLVETLRQAGVGPESRVVYQVGVASGTTAAMPVAACLLGFSIIHAMVEFDYTGLSATHFIRSTEQKPRHFQGCDDLPIVEFDSSVSPENSADLIAACPGPAKVDDIGLIIASSGTTGVPKAVPVTFANLAKRCALDIA